MKLVVSAADISGDAHGALLVHELKKHSPGVTFYAVGGERLEETGAELLENSAAWSAIGIFDALQKVPGIYQAFRRVKRRLLKIKPDGLILIDAPAFNVPLARFAYSHGIRSVYFFPPSSWKRDLRRAARVGRWIEKVIAPFRETAELYAKAGVPTFFSGHPLLDRMEALRDSRDVFRELGLDPARPVVGLFPGSRRQEIRYLLPLMLDVAGILHHKNRKLQFALPIAAKILERPILSQIAGRTFPILARGGISREVMQISERLLVASGTATLEAALWRKPTVIIYKVSSLSWKLERPFIKGVRFAGLPNLLANAAIVPELIQEDATVDRIVDEMDLLLNHETRTRMAADLQSILPQLGEPGVMDRVAGVVLETFHG